MRSRWKSGPYLMARIGMAVAALAMLLPGQEGAGGAVSEERLAVYPARFTLDSAAERQPLVVVWTRSGGITVDVSAEVAIHAEPAGVVRVQDGVVEPFGPGKAVLSLEYGGLVAKVDVSVSERAVAESATSFRNDVIPALTRAGCNAGACHGAKVGKNGFGLSLFGYDPGRDHRILTRDIWARRVDPSMPDDSLLLTKPLGVVAHKGGPILTESDVVHSILRRWIQQGAVDDGDAAPALVGIDVAPAELVLPGKGAEVRMTVTARYDDDTTRDVTALALLSSSAPSSAAVDDAGLVRAGGPGEAYVMARFGAFAEVSQVLVLEGDLPPATIVVEPVNRIDELVFAKLRKLRLQPAARCEDSTFIRRVWLDLLGTLPPAEDVSTFLADRREDKRARLVDDLLGRPEFATWFSTYWEEVLRIEEEQLRRKGTWLWTRWLRESVRDGRPFDAVVRDMLTATGSTFRTPEANYYKVSSDPKVLAESAAQTFFGIRLQCAQCHDHPFERWRMDDYYGFAAFFGQISRKTGGEPEELVVYDRRSGDVRNERTGAVAAPTFLGGVAPEITRGTDRRRVLAEWVTAADNPWFARNVANRIWARLLGRGLVEPVDDVRASNPPSHPALHAWLGERFAASGFDVRAVYREICSSHTYQAAQLPDGAPASSFAGQQPRRLAAEQMLDAVGAVTGVRSDLQQLPAGARAIHAVGAAGDRFLQLFGRSARESVCACERREEPTLGQVLHLINGRTIEQRLGVRGAWLDTALGSERPDEELLRELWLRAYARPPRAHELEDLVAELAATAADDEKAHRALWQDVLWAVLNSKEFLFQH